MIDIESLRPLRWEVSVSTPAKSDNVPAKMAVAYFFEYGKEIDLRPPDGVAPATCIDR